MFGSRNPRNGSRSSVWRNFLEIFLMLVLSSTLGDIFLYLLCVVWMICNKNIGLLHTEVWMASTRSIPQTLHNPVHFDLFFPSHRVMRVTSDIKVLVYNTEKNMRKDPVPCCYTRSLLKSIKSAGMILHCLSDITITNK